MDTSLKAGARHSAGDYGHINGAKAHARQIMEHMAALGADEDAPTKAAQVAPDAHPGAMVCLMLTPEQQAEIRDAAGMPDAEADHVTLAYLGPDAGALLPQKNALLRCLSNVASMAAPLAGEVGGVARFAASESSDGQDVLVALYDSAELPDLYADVIEALDACGIAPASDHGFTPHITLGYVRTDSTDALSSLPRLPLPIAAITLVWAGERIDLPLTGAAGMDEAEIGLRDALGMRSLPDDTLIYAGDAVKSLPSGHVGGYLVRFSTPNDPDLAGEYFTKDTYFGIKIGDRTHVWFHHRGAFKTRDGRTLRITDPIGEGTLKIDDVGVFVDAVLFNRERYEGILADLGWSSGTASHLVDTIPEAKAAWIKRWYLGLDATLTFSPCEPRNSAVPLKSLPEAVASPSFDTKSVDTPELDTETVLDQPVVAKSVLPALVMGYIALNESTIKGRLDRLRRTIS